MNDNAWDTLCELIVEAGLTPTFSEHCVSGLLQGGRDACECSRCRKRRGLPPDEALAKRAAEEARLRFYRR